MVRFTPGEHKRVREIVKANTGTMSEFIRTCVNRELAIAGDPKGMELLMQMFEPGIKEMLKRAVEAEAQKARESETP